MSKSKRLVFFGTENFSAAALIKLISSGYNVVAVVTKPDSVGGRGRQKIVPRVKTIAEKASIKVLQPLKLSDIDQEIAELKPDYGVLAAYGKIIPLRTIELFPLGIINIHPSLLPKYRGPSPVETAILNGDKETGVSLMELSAGMDEGPVYAVRKIALTGMEEAGSFSLYLFEVGAELLLEKLPEILSGQLKPKKQPTNGISYSKLHTKSDGTLDFKKPAELLERQVRAYNAWPRSTASIEGVEVIVTRARIGKNQADGSLIIRCQPGWLEIKELIAPSGRKISGAEFLRGYSKQR